MREVSVKVFNFNELDEDTQNEILNRELEEVDFSDEVEEYMDQVLAEMGFKELQVGNFSLEGEENNGYVYLEGSFHEQLSFFEKHPESELFNKISSAYVSEDDVEDENGLGLSIFMKNEDDYETEDYRRLQALFVREFAEIEEQILEKAHDFFEKKNDEAINKIKKIMSDFEFLSDGTVFDKDMES